MISANGANIPKAHQYIGANNIAPAISRMISRVVPIKNGPLMSKSDLLKSNYF